MAPGNRVGVGFRDHNDVTGSATQCIIQRNKLPNVTSLATRDIFRHREA